MGGVALAGSWVYPRQDRAGIVYGDGLRRCLIIFAPHTLILDRRTRTSRAPSLPWILQRSENFTSGATISSTPNGPLDSVRRRAVERRPHAHTAPTGEKRNGALGEHAKRPTRRPTRGRVRCWWRAAHPPRHTTKLPLPPPTPRMWGRGRQSNALPDCPEWAPRPRTTLCGHTRSMLRHSMDRHSAIGRLL